MKGLGAIWTFLNGWKTFLVAFYLMYREICAAHACGVGISYGDAAMRSLGWNADIAAFDAHQAALAVLFLIAVGHKLAKAIQQYRAGVSVVDIQP